MLPPVQHFPEMWAHIHFSPCIAQDSLLVCSHRFELLKQQFELFGGFKLNTINTTALLRTCSIELCDHAAPLDVGCCAPPAGIQLLLRRPLPCAQVHACRLLRH